MTTSTLVDSNVLIDVLARAGEWYPWSRARLTEVVDAGDVFNQVVFAETAIRFDKTGDIDEVVELQATRENLPWDAARLAGLAHRSYRKSGGPRDRTLPDFLIGAHAQVRGYRLLTRDPRRYRAYFPDVEIIAPDTHP